MFEKLLKIILLTIIPISFFGLYQHFNGTERVYSTFGQPNWLAQYLCMLLPLCIFKCLKESFKTWFPIYLIGFSCFWFTYSISGVLAFIISITFLFIFMNQRSVFERKSMLKFLVLFFFTLIIASSNLGIFKEKVQDAIYDVKQKTSFLKRVYAAEDTHKVSDPGFIRLELWKSTFDLILSSPKTFLIGTGPETFPYEFQEFRNLKLNYSSEWDFVFNKPHNYFLEIWAELGILGFISFSILLVHVLRKTTYYLRVPIISLLTTSFFGWPVISTTLLFWFLVSYSEVSDD
ncbi:O-antigen ligase family protein [Patescibacteria group bacterium]